jgi:nitroreductase
MSFPKAPAILEQLRWRYAVKAFDPSRKIPSEHWDTLKECLRLSPSSYGLQPWKFLIIENPEIRKKLRVVSWDQSAVEEASHFIVFTSRRLIDDPYVDKYIARIASERGLQVEQLAGYRQMIQTKVMKLGADEVLSWTRRQTYIALGFLLESAALLGIDTVPLEGLEAEKYDEILGLEKTDYATVCAVALGYRSSTDKYQHLKKTRFAPEDVFETIK